LVDGANVCKIADFGLCKRMETEESPLDTQQSEQSTTQLRLCFTTKEDQYMAIPWQSPEVLACKGTYRFDEASDVWAYGITLCEIYEHGIAPFPDLSTAELTTLGRQGNLRKELPVTRCPRDVEEYVLKRCLETNPLRRPRFSALFAIVDDLNKRPTTPTSTSTATSLTPTPPITVVVPPTAAPTMTTTTTTASDGSQRLMYKKIPMRAQVDYQNVEKKPQQQPRASPTPGSNSQTPFMYDLPPKPSKVSSIKSGVFPSCFDQSPSGFQLPSSVKSVGPLPVEIKPKSRLEKNGYQFDISQRSTSPALLDTSVPKVFHHQRSEFTINPQEGEQFQQRVPSEDFMSTLDHIGARK